MEEHREDRMNSPEEPLAQAAEDPNVEIDRKLRQVASGTHPAQGMLWQASPP